MMKGSVGDGEAERAERDGLQVVETAAEQAKSKKAGCWLLQLTTERGDDDLNSCCMGRQQKM